MASQDYAFNKEKNSYLSNVTLLNCLFSGSFSFSILSGKMMFRDFHIITEDYSLRIQFGWVIFRWWRPYVYKAINEGMYVYVYIICNICNCYSRI